MKKKLIASLLLATMLLSSFTGCTGTPSASQSSAETSTESVAQSDVSGEDSTATSSTGSAIPEEMTKLTVELFDRNNVPQSQGTLEDNQWTNWIKEEMKKLNIDVTYVPIPRWEEGTKLNVLLASGTAPDISFTYNLSMVTEYAADGGVHDLSSYMDTYGKDIVEVYEPYGILEYGNIEGKQYAIPAMRTNVSHFNSFIRKDWLDELGLEVPTNKEELVEVLRAFKEKDPSIIPWGNFNNAAGGFANTGSQYDVMYSFFNHSEEELYTTPPVLREGFKDFMKWLNELYAEGLIDQEFATKTTGEIKNADIINDKVGFFSECAWIPYGADSAYRALLERNPDAEYIPIEVFDNEDGHYYKSNYAPVGLYMFVPKSAKSPEAAVTYLNWMADYDVAFKLKFGNEGEQYEMQDGVPVVTDPEKTQETFGYISGDLNLLWNGFHPDTSEEIINAQYLNTAGPELVDFAIASQEMAIKDGVTELVIPHIFESENNYNAELSNTYDAYWSKLITSKDFEKDYETFMNEVKSREIEEILAERTEYYNTEVKGN